MASNRLNDTSIRRAKVSEKTYYLQDGGGLMLRIRPDGRRDWMWRYVSPSTGKRVALYPGTYPDLTLKSAREFAQQRRELVARGIDPKRATVALEELDPNAVPHTVAQLHAKWFKDEIEVHRKSESDHASIRSRYKNYIMPTMGDCPLATVSRRHAMKAIDNARAGGKMRTANLLLAEMHQMFGYAVAREWMQGDPCAGIKRRDAGGKDGESERFLPDDELVMLRDILRRPPTQRTRYYTAVRTVLPVRSELMLWWTLATAARPVEVATIKLLGHVDTKARTWTIPSSIAKNNRAHEIHLSDLALAIWSRILLLPKSGEYAFWGSAKGAKDGQGHVSEKELTRRLTDRQTRQEPIKGRKNCTDLDLPGGHWTQHDMRRTASTIMGELNFTPAVIDRCLNHVEPKKTTRTYQRQLLKSQQREAFDAVSTHVCRLLGPPDDWLPTVPATSANDRPQPKT